MHTCLSLHVLGGFSLSYQSRPVTIASQRIQALVTYLALRPNQSHSRQSLAFLLWPDSSDSQAFTNLRTLLHRLNAVFPEASDLLVSDANALRWREGIALACDVNAFERAVEQAADAAPEARIEALRQAVALYTGDLLPDCHDEWVIAERDRLKQALFAALGQLVSLLEQERRYGEATLAAQKLLRLDPLNEETCLTLMRLHAVDGDRASALHVYHTCASLLASELGVTPGERLQAAYEQLLAGNRPTEAMHASVPLVGRQHEWRRILAAWEAAVSGQPRLLMLSGEAGIGKTRLAEEFVVWAERQGVTTAITRCYAAEGSLAYGPVMTLLRSDAFRERVAQLSPQARAQILRLMPDAGAERPPSAPPTSQRWQRQQLFEALAQVVLSASRRLLLVFDDLQWADRETLEWLHFLLRYQAQARLLIIGTLRVDEVDAAHAAVDLLQTLRREARIVEIGLTRLSPDDTAALAGAIAGETLDEQQAGNLYADTEGNPLFVVETLRAQALGSDTAALERVPAPGEAVLPPAIHAVIAWRLRQLSPQARALLDAASVIGRSFRFDVLAQAAALDEQATVHALDELWQRQVIHEDGLGRYDFTHGKLQAVAYSELPPAQRRHLHHRVAQALEQHAGGSETVAGELAAHFTRAGMPERATTYHLQAAAYARSIYANEAALEHYRQALALMPDHSTDQIATVAEQYGDLLHFVGQHDAARAVYEQALAHTQAAIPRATLYRKLGNAYRDQYHYDDAMQAYDDAEAALDHAPDAGDRLFVWREIQIERANVFYWRAQTAEIFDLLRQIEPLFANCGHILHEARFHQIVGIAALQRDRFAGSLEAVARMRSHLQLLQQANEVTTLPAAHFQMAFTLLNADGDFREAEHCLRVALEAAERNGDISLEARCLTYLTVVMRMTGQPEQVQSYAERSLRVAQAAHMPEYAGAAYGNFAWLAWRQGNAANARAHGQTAAEIWNKHGVRYMFEWIGRLPYLAVALVDGDLPLALEQASALVDSQQKRLPEPLESALRLALRAVDDGDEHGSRKALTAAINAAQEHHYL